MGPLLGNRDHTKAALFFLRNKLEKKICFLRKTAYIASLLWGQFSVFLSGSFVVIYFLMFVVTIFKQKERRKKEEREKEERERREREREREKDA